MLMSATRTNAVVVRVASSVEHPVQIVVLSLVQTVTRTELFTSLLF